MVRDNTRWIEKRYDSKGKPICLIPNCKNICEQFKNKNYRNYCQEHTFNDMSEYTNWQSLRRKCLKRDGYRCVKCGDDREEIAIKITRRNAINLHEVIKNWNLKITPRINIKYEKSQVERTVTNLEADHIKEIADGGDQWDINNLQTLCYKCHKQKTSLFNSKAYSPQQQPLILEK